MRLKFLRFPEIHALTGLSRRTIQRLEQSQQFPQHIAVSANIVGWRLDQVQAWLKSRSQHSRPVSKKASRAA